MESEFSDLTLFLILPVTVATAERSFSKLKILKNYLRNTMTEDRLSELAVLAIESKETRKINVGKIISDFAQMRQEESHFNM